MNRRVAILVGSVIAAIAAGEIVVLSGLLAAERQGDRDRYDDAMTRQRRAAGRLTQVSRPAPTRRPQTFCVRGVDTFATTARKTLQKELLDGKRRLDVTELEAISDLAIRAERYVETASAGPALPQRLGRTRVAQAVAPGEARPGNNDKGDKPGAAPRSKKTGNKTGETRPAEPEGPVWQPLQPAQIECEDQNAYAAFRLEVPAPPVAPPEPRDKSNVSSKKKKPARRR